MRASLTGVSPQSRSLFSASFQTFCLTVRAYLNTQKYGLFCSLRANQRTQIFATFPVWKKKMLPSTLDLVPSTLDPRQKDRLVQAEVKSMASDESIFLSRVEGRGFHVEGEGTKSRVEGNIFFFQIFFFFGKGNNRCNQCH